MDENGKEIYTFEVSYDGTNYTIAICGVPVQGGVNITNHLNKLNADGEFYVGVSFHTGAAATKLEATMLKFGTSADDATVPTGSDSKEPEENINVTAEIADPDTVPENQPALLFDATEKTCTNKFGTSAMELIPQGNNSFKVEPSAAVGFHQWPIKKSLSYDAKDFPVIAVFIEDPNEIFDSGVIRYSAGDNMTADDVHVLTYSIWDDNCKYYGENEEYTLMVIDMRELLDEAALEEGWNGRINGLRFDYGSLYLSNPVDPETDYFFFHYAGIFRSVEEAYAYNEEYAASLGLTEAEPETDEPVDETDEPATGDAGETDALAGETNAPAGETDAATKAPETTAQKSGCSGVIGSVAVLMTAAAAAVVLKKRD